MNNKECEHIIRLARLYASEKMPWFAPALFACQIHQTHKVEVAAISSNLGVYFNPNAIITISGGSKDRQDAICQIAYLWLHEIAHILREHESRAKEVKAEPLLWNIACDIEINDVPWKGFEPPTQFQPCLPDQFDLEPGLIAEQYYKKLIYLNHNIEYWDEGSGVHGQCRDWETGDTRWDINIVTSHIRLQTAKLIKQHAIHGKIPGSWQQWANLQMQSRTDWRNSLKHKLRLAITQTLGGKLDYTYLRPHRRQHQLNGVILPTLHGEWKARLACVIDTSGSMSSDQIGQAIAEAFAILAQFNAPTTIIPCDAEAYSMLEIKQKSDLIKVQTLKGGGGTNMVVGIESALNIKPQPDAIVVLTDGYTDYPQKKYSIPVIFGIIQDINNEFDINTIPVSYRDSIVKILIHS